MHAELNTLATDIKQWAQALGFQQTAIIDTDLAQTGERLQSWLDKGYHGDMGYMAEHGSKRFRPAELIDGTRRIISLRFNYYPECENYDDILTSPNKAAISRYTLGRDYHKTLRARLKKLVARIEARVNALDLQSSDESTAPITGDFRVFVDSAPVMERAIAEKGGLGWVGKNTMIINKKAGSYFFLAEIYTNLPLPMDTDVDNKNHCGDCRACLDACPTQAFEGPYVLDGTKCISYLTIELKGSIPLPLRSKMGNRIFGCDDCQTVCPWNRFTRIVDEQDFSPRQNLDKSELLELFAWTEEEFLSRTEGSAIRRTGYVGWLRNIAVALGNATTSLDVISALKARETHPSEIVREHVSWALAQHQ
ncbi:MAG: tRNA epoxyqueuosine(34) reductase QueG [Hahellaceae bacterium]|jgi:epoxyqueuosine reductase|nr:tRNA epoxyqueuosine(34) reductase QueG [Hahellaceae bacterium]MCP5211148.1 tRNA epoxyqueuosine(34) reductase QueG [Hahellaceae bacterium]